MSGIYYRKLVWTPAGYSITTEFNALLNKIIKYQNKPVVGDLRKNLMNGEWLYQSPGQQYYTVGGSYLELLIGSHTAHGYTTNGIPANRSFNKLYGSDRRREGSHR